MTTWILIIAVGGFVGLSDIKTIKMTEQQCKATLLELKPLRRNVGAACVSPNGESFNLDTIKDKGETP